MKNVHTLKALLLIVPVFLSGCTAMEKSFHMNYTHSKHFQGKDGFLMGGAKYDLDAEVLALDPGTIKAVELKVLPSQLAKHPELITNIVIFKKLEEDAREAGRKEYEKNGEWGAIKKDLLSFRGLLSMAMLSQGVPVSKVVVNNLVGGKTQDVTALMDGLEIRYKENFHAVQLFMTPTPQCQLECAQVQAKSFADDFAKILYDKRYSLNESNATFTTEYKRLLITPHDKPDKVYKGFVPPTMYEQKVRGGTLYTSDPTRYIEIDPDMFTASIDDYTNRLLPLLDKYPNLEVFVPPFLRYAEAEPKQYICYGGFFATHDTFTKVEAFKCQHDHIKEEFPERFVAK